MKECIEWFFSMFGICQGKGEKGKREKVVWFIGDEILKVSKKN